MNGRCRLEAPPVFYCQATARGENEYCRNIAAESYVILSGQTRMIPAPRIIEDIR